MAKMDWAVEAYKNGNFESELHSNSFNRDFGTFCKATGVGKSGDIIKEIVYRIKHSNGKTIINFSEFFLKLSEQLSHDIFEFLTHPDVNLLNPAEAGIYMNSSDSARRLSKDFEDYDWEKYSIDTIKKENKKINFVISCNKSLYKFINDSAEFEKSGYEIINFLDESHTLSIEVSVNKKTKAIEFTEDDGSNIGIDLKELCKHSTACYAISATPDVQVTKMLLEFDREHNPAKPIEYAIYENPQKSILENKIVPPNIDFSKTPMGARFDAKYLIEVMKRAKAIQPTLEKHKILVTTKSVEEANSIFKTLADAGQNVFMVTCEGFKTNTVGPKNFTLNKSKKTEDEFDFENMDILGFVKAVEDFDGDCFVIHIRILIAGIDIKSLTDCVIYANTHQTATSEFGRHTIQTIGRTLRTLSGERGMDREERKKKFGGVFFVIPEDKPEVEAALRALVVKYYSFDNLEFQRHGCVNGKRDNENEFYSFGGEDTSTSGEEFFNTLYLQPMMDTVERVKPIVKAYVEAGVWKKAKEKEIERISKEIENNVGRGKLSTVDWLLEDNVYDYIAIKLKNYLENVGVKL